MMLLAKSWPGIEISQGVLQRWISSEFCKDGFPQTEDSSKGLHDLMEMRWADAGRDIESQDDAR